MASCYLHWDSVSLFIIVLLILPPLLSPPLLLVFGLGKEWVRKNNKKKNSIWGPVSTERGTKVYINLYKRVASFSFLRAMFWLESFLWVYKQWQVYGQCVLCFFLFVCFLWKSKTCCSNRTCTELPYRPEKCIWRYMNLFLFWWSIYPVFTSVYLLQDWLVCFPSAFKCCSTGSKPTWLLTASGIF